MPHVQLYTPTGHCFYVSSRERETLRRWFDEVLPHASVQGRPDDDFETMWPRVSVTPMWSWGKVGEGGPDPDWLTDSRVLGRVQELAAVDGEQGLAKLDEIRAELEAELGAMPQR